jgi:CDP-glucose 4,6-dehydratase
MFGDIYRGRRVLLTGHTGFKGSWLALWLQALGAEIIGLSLAPKSTPSHWGLLSLDIEDHRIDIRDKDAVAKVIQKSAPELIFHLAAQPLVSRSYKDPLETWSTNVIGTANVLEACRKQPSVGAIVVVTTDKCYENREWEWGYRENDRLGGHDPYSASKASAELVVASYRSAFFSHLGTPLIASARAGNVIGGGDWSEGRLIPDLMRAISTGTTLEVRYPNATRPWQHVLEALSGYLCLGQKLIEGRKEFSQAWNFGPGVEGNRTVVEVLSVLSRLKALWPALNWKVVETSNNYHESSLLHLDSAKARQRLDWQPVWSFDEGLQATAKWYRANIENGLVISEEQLQDYLASAAQLGLPWRSQ